MRQPFSWNNLQYPIILCPPMDGITDMAYRELVAIMGGSSVRYCEFINVKGLIYQNPKTLFELRYTENQRPIIAQLFGHEPEDFYEAAKYVVRLGFDAIDINMGCPAHKVASKGSGCALMENTEVAKEIIRKSIQGANEEWRKVKAESAVELDKSTPHHQPGTTNLSTFPVSCKMRLGVSSNDRVFEHGMAMIEAGAECIAIHGRTLKQMYTGEADWEPIKKFKEIVGSESRVKVFGSGDVKSLWEAFIRIMTTGVDGVMIGRGSFGNPWVFNRTKVELLRKYCIESGYPNRVESIEEIRGWREIKEQLDNKMSTFEEVKNIAIKHAELMVQDKGEKGIIQMRKHLGWYFTGFDGAKQLRSRLVTVNSLEEVVSILNTFEDHEF